MTMRHAPARYVVLSICAVLAAAGTVATVLARPLDTQSGAQQLSRAITLYATDDDGPQAERMFLGVIAGAPVSTPDGATARYYLGRLYHRNYYMLGQRDALDRAVDRYKDVHNTATRQERRGAWYADARFYKSLAYLEQGKWKDVEEAIAHIDPSLDDEIEVDYLVWNLRKRSVNKRVKTGALREEYLMLLKRLKITATRPGPDPKARDAVLAGLHQVLQK